MSLLENFVPVVKYNGLNTDKDAVLGGTLAVTGAVSITGQLGAKELTETATADDTLTISESGKTIYMGTAGVDITLPAVATAAGVVYRFVCSANFASTNMTIKTSGLEDKIYGSLEVAGAVVLCSAEDLISFVNTAELPGDWCELRSDGTNWYISGQAGASGGMTCTAT
tara:strand:- start:6794 stop:7300 length:507 start_codon:yes stop_codon:yes gene_type:complete